MPLVDYAINYAFIAKNLCENRNTPQLTCKGKCYVKKELAKAEKQSNSIPAIKIQVPDIFISGEILVFLDDIEPDPLNKVPNSGYLNFYTSEYISQIFHPPLV